MELFSVTLSVVSTSVDHLVRNSNPIVIEAFIFYHFGNQTNILMCKWGLMWEKKYSLRHNNIFDCFNRYESPKERSLWYAHKKSKQKLNKKITKKPLKD